MRYSFYFSQLKKRRLLPTDRTYSSMFAACGSAGPQAFEILGKVRSEMERREVPLNTITANALMSALAMCGQHQEATQVRAWWKGVAKVERNCCIYADELCTGTFEYYDK